MPRPWPPTVMHWMHNRNKSYAYHAQVTSRRNYETGRLVISLTGRYGPTLAGAGYPTGVSDALCKHRANPGLWHEKSASLCRTQHISPKTCSSPATRHRSTWLTPRRPREILYPERRAKLLICLAARSRGDRPERHETSEPRRPCTVRRGSWPILREQDRTMKTDIARGVTASTGSESKTEKLPPAESQFGFLSLIAATAGVAFLAASIATNVAHAISVADSTVKAVISGAIAGACALGLAVTIPALLSALRGRAYAAAAMTIVAAILFGSYSITAALGALGSARLTASVNEVTYEERLARARAAYSAASETLRTTAAARPMAELDAEHRRLSAAIAETDCRGWVRNIAVRQACADRLAIEVEQGRARAIAEARRAQAVGEAQLDRLQAQPARPANADAVMLAKIFGQLGLTAGADMLTTALVVLGVAVLELGAGLSFGIAGTMRASTDVVVLNAVPQLDPGIRPALPSTEVSTPPHRKVSTKVSMDASMDTSSKASTRSCRKVSRSPARGRGVEMVAAALRDAILAKGGRWDIGVRGIAGELSTSRGTAQNAIDLLLSTSQIARDMDGALTVPTQCR